MTRWPEGRFGELALRAFRVQFEHVEPYRRYCRSRGVSGRGSTRDLEGEPFFLGVIAEDVHGKRAEASIRIVELR